MSLYIILTYVVKPLMLLRSGGKDELELVGLLILFVVNVEDDDETVRMSVILSQ